MCQYTVTNDDGVPTAWHQVHYGSRAVQGYGLAVIEATGVVPEGRITVADLGLWNDAQTEAFRSIVDFCHSQGSAVGIQLAHAGRKGSTWPDRPGAPSGFQPLDQGGYSPVGPTNQPFPGLAVPQQLTIEQIRAVPAAFAAAARRADAAGIDVAEVHAAHGYLLHEFYSPLSNTRHDEYGGDFAGRTRLVREVVSAVRAVWPESKPLFVRVSATDWVDQGWNGDDTVQLAIDLKGLGVDLIDVSTGGNLVTDIPVGPGYQVRFAERVRREAEIATSAVGMITKPEQAEQILRTGQADAVMLGREALRNPGWPEQAAFALGAPSPLAGPYRRARLSRH
jgi:2,4-dienoyl-CoA reductase-like NADH-dependent reductase (Old Yellow Enzyme family)